MLQEETKLTVTTGDPAPELSFKDKPEFAIPNQGRLTRSGAFHAESRCSATTVV